MKFIVSMKDPDTLIDAIEDAVKVEDFPGLDKEEQEIIREKRKEKVYDQCCEKWFRYGEYLDVEIDTDTMTCMVIERG